MSYGNHVGGKATFRQLTELTADKWGIPNPNASLLPDTTPKFKVGEVVKNALGNQYTIQKVEFSPARGNWKYTCTTGSVESCFFEAELTLVATPAPKPVKKHEIKTLRSDYTFGLDEQIAQYLNEGWEIIWQAVEAVTFEDSCVTNFYVRLHRVVEVIPTPEPPRTPEPMPEATTEATADELEAVRRLNSIFADIEPTTEPMPEVEPAVAPEPTVEDVEMGIIADLVAGKTKSPVGEIDPTKPVLELVATHGAEAVAGAVREHTHNVGVKAAKNVFEALHGLHGDELAQKALEIITGVEVGDDSDGS